VSQTGEARCLVGIALESEEEPTMAGMPRTAPEDRGGSTSRDGRPDPATEAFLAHRNLLFTVAYELLGSAADAEDVLQETWLRWAGVDLGAVRDQRAYLVRVTARQALTRLRTLGRRRESYVGPWLPEPLLTAPDVAEDVELAESVSMALLLVLETVPLGLAGAGPGWPAAPNGPGLPGCPPWSGEVFRSWCRVAAGGLVGRRASLVRPGPPVGSWSAPGLAVPRPLGRRGSLSRGTWPTA
jgi:hypothetical protein